MLPSLNTPFAASSKRGCSRSLFRTSSSDTDCILTFGFDLSVPTLRRFCRLRTTIWYDMVWYDMKVKFLASHVVWNACTGASVSFRFQLFVHGAVYAGNDDQGLSSQYSYVLLSNLQFTGPYDLERVAWMPIFSIKWLKWAGTRRNWVPGPTKLSPCVPGRLAPKFAQFLSELGCRNSDARSWMLR